MRVTAGRAAVLAAFVGVLLLALAPVGAAAASREKIDARVNETLARFYEKVKTGRGIVDQAAGVLVFPRITKGGFILGGEYGEGALIVDGTTVGYYSIASPSIGLQFGLQTKSLILVFLSREALERFRRSDGWAIGVDANVTLVEVGASTDINTEISKTPIMAFVLDHKGLMAGISLEGTKISRIER
ncbi:MAG: lipoprotein [Rhodothalassiaceae bacterium]|nr:MAG: lipoprotein [Rhodothalassiaceae bacterium]